MKLLLIFAVTLACATAALTAEDRIHNGNTAAKAQFPYQVGLTMKLSYIESIWCGGSLIGNQWVLTAAHCTDYISNAIVYLGSNARENAEVTYTVYRSDFIIHPEWSSSTKKNDIALIKIPSVSYTKNIQAVKLPAMASSYSSYTGDFAIASGWGRTKDTSFDLSAQLQFARMQIITNDECAKDFGSKISPSNICVATPGGVSTCNGDSGGPLVLESSAVQVGITSFGSAAGCGWFYPAVFTRVTSYLGWIRENTDIFY